jgi:hypothetical protein
VLLDASAHIQDPTCLDGTHHGQDIGAGDLLQLD